MVVAGSGGDGTEDERDGNTLFIVVALMFQIVFVILFIVGTDYRDGDCIANENDECESDHSLHQYAVFQDVHGMIFVGFGFLMTFLRRYAFGSISFNFLISAFCIQWTIIIFGVLTQGAAEPGHGWGEHHRKKVWIGIDQLLDADLGAAVTLISFGAVLGRLEPVALLVMAFVEITLYAINFYICVHWIKIIDVGGSIVVHTFGAYFGLGVSYFIGKPKDVSNNKSMYHSDLFSMIGTLFLWLYWPSFNAFFASEENYFKERAFVNTVLALAGGTVTTFILSSFFHEKGKFEMVHIQNSTLAGGVAVGSVADLYLHPAGALGIGIVGAAISVFGYSKIHEFLMEWKPLRLYDTCGVHYLHGLPGVFSALVGAIVIASSSSSHYKGYELFPRMDDNYQRQAGAQVAGILVTLLISIVGGGLTGFFLSIMFDGHKHPYTDMDNFVVPDASAEDFFRGTIRGAQFAGPVINFDDDDDE